MHLKYLFIIFFLISGNYLFAQTLSFEDVKLEQNTDNALRIQALITTSEPAHVYIQYSYTQNGVIYTEKSAVNPLQNEHDITIVALRDSTFYKFRIFAFNKQNQIQSQSYELTTRSLPLALKNFQIPSVNLLENRQTYTLTNNTQGTRSHLFICDAQGRLVWYDTYPVIHSVCNGWRWSKDNTILQADCRTIREMDLFGNQLLEINIDEPQWNLHHDVMKLRDGNIIAIYTKPEMADLSQMPGTPATTATVAVDGYIIVNKEGEILENWSASDHFDIQTAKRKGAYWSLIYGSGTVDWCHFNALEEDIDGNILVSVSHWSRILKIDRTTGTVIWQLGEGGTLRVPPDFVIKQQHAITTLAPNRYLIFDNLGLQESSRAIEFAVETNENRAFQFWEYIPQPNVVCVTRGNAQRLLNGNTLIFFPANREGSIQEVDANGNLLWKLFTERAGYRAYRIPYINAPHPQVRFEDVPNSICENTKPFKIATVPEEAYLVGEAIEDGLFNPQKANKGINKVFATFGTSLKEIEIEVLDAPQPSTSLVNNQIITIEDTFEIYQWFENDTLIEGATMPQYEPEAAGLYFAEATNENGCTAYSDTLNFVYVSVAENINTLFEVTQFSDHLMIKHPLAQSITVQIFDLQGKKIEEQQGKNSYQINSIYFPSMYLLCVYDGQQFRVKKMLNY